MTKILLTRHGHVDGITPERFRGRQPLALTEHLNALAAEPAFVWTPLPVFPAVQSIPVLPNANAAADRLEKLETDLHATIANLDTTFDRLRRLVPKEEPVHV